MSVEALRVAIAAAGTGGHIYPGLAVAQELRRLARGVDITFLTTRRGLGPALLGQHGETVRAVTGEPAPKGMSWGLVHFGVALGVGTAEAAAVLRRCGAQVLLATGGYGCAPAVVAARIRRIPVVWQEQNALPGRATRLLARWARVVALGYAEAKDRLPAVVRHRAVVTGNPVRAQVTGVSRAEAMQRLGLDPTCMTVLVVGASQGARSFNRAVAEVAQELGGLKGVQVLVSTGRGQFGETVALLRERCPEAAAGDSEARVGRLRIVPYFDDMAAAVAAADLAVTRASAVSLAEFSARGVPLVLVPYPFAAERHQDHNAEVFRRAGAGVVVPDRELTGPRLVAVIRELTGDRARLAAMREASGRLGRPQAAEEVAELVMNAVKR